MLFDANLMYSKGPSCEDREKIANVVLEERTRKILKTSNIMANILIPAIACLCSNCNLLIVFIAFLATDILMNLIDHYLIVMRPHYVLREGLLSEAKKLLQSKIERRDLLETQINQYSYDKRKKEWTFSEYCAWQDEKEDLDLFIEYEQDWVNNKLIPYKEEELRTMQKPVKDYTDKQQFFATFAGQIHQYITLYGLNCLKPVAQSLKSLMTILETKQNGYELIPQTLYVYINELQKTLVKISSVTNEQREEHTQDLVKVSNILSKNINRIVEKIKNTDAAEIDVSLSVLIQELEKEVAQC